MDGTNNYGHQELRVTIFSIGDISVAPVLAGELDISTKLMFAKAGAGIIELPPDRLLLLLASLVMMVSRPPLGPGGSPAVRWCP